MPALELITGRATNPGAGPTALTPGTGDSFTVRSFPFEQGAAIEGVWYQGATTGFVQIRSPRMHDNVRGLRLRAPANRPSNLLVPTGRQRLFPQDVLTIEISGGAAETDAAAVLLYYADLPGVQQRLGAWEQIQPRIASVLSIDMAIANPATTGDWSVGDPINEASGGDLLKANVDYAVLGYTADANSLAVALRGPDTGNMKVGGPGDSGVPFDPRQWFVDLSRITGLPHIPIINAANKGATLAFVANVTAAGSTTVSFVLAELTPGA